MLNNRLKGSREATAVGDLNSDAQGSGARKNEGKARVELIPLKVWKTRWTNLDPENTKITNLMFFLSQWQECTNLDYYGYRHLSSIIKDQSLEDMIEATEVLEYGLEKYEEWNWAKGMRWSVPTGCIIRHAIAILEKGELLDEESGKSHYAHILCNVIMLLWFIDNYPEGDDRPPTYEKIK